MNDFDRKQINIRFQHIF